MTNNNSLPRPHLDDCDIKDYGPTKCQQHLAKMCDINNVVARALAGDTTVIRKGSYADVTSLPESLQDALNCQLRAREAYDALPPDARAKWRDPAAFFAAASDPAQQADFVRFGLAFERSPEGPIEVKVINSSPAKPDAPSTGAACA